MCSRLQDPFSDATQLTAERIGRQGAGVEEMLEEQAVDRSDQRRGGDFGMDVDGDFAARLAFAKRLGKLGAYFSEEAAEALGIVEAKLDRHSADRCPIVEERDVCIHEFQDPLDDIARRAQAGAKQRALVSEQVWPSAWVAVCCNKHMMQKKERWAPSGGQDMADLSLLATGNPANGDSRRGHHATPNPCRPNHGGDASM